MTLLLENTLVGQTSGAIGLFVEQQSSSVARFVFLNELQFDIGENIQTSSSGITATVNDTFAGDSNILDRSYFRCWSKRHYS